MSVPIIFLGFRPGAEVVLGLTLHRWNVVRWGGVSPLAGCAGGIVTAGLISWLLRGLGAVTPSDVTASRELTHVASPTTKEILLSGVGALAGAVIMAAYWRGVIASALVARVIIPATAASGMALAAGRLDLAVRPGARRAGRGAHRGGGVVVFGVKQLTGHRRTPLV